jgi:chromosomal replication initiation ATPase DnaA
MTLKEIGVQTGGFDHTTIINSIKRAGQLLETDDSFISMYESAIDKLGNQKK